MSPNLMGQCAEIPHAPPQGSAFRRIFATGSSFPGKPPREPRVTRDRRRGIHLSCALAMPQQAPIPGCVVILEFANELACVPCTPCVPGDWQFRLVILLTWPWQAGTAPSRVLGLRSGFSLCTGTGRG